MTDTYGQLIASIERGGAAERLYPLRDALAKRYADPTIRSPTRDTSGGRGWSIPSITRESPDAATIGG